MNHNLTEIVDKLHQLHLDCDYNDLSTNALSITFPSGTGMILNALGGGKIRIAATQGFVSKFAKMLNILAEPYYEYNLAFWEVTPLQAIAFVIYCNEELAK